MYKFLACDLSHCCSTPLFYGCGWSFFEVRTFSKKCFESFELRFVPLHTAHCSHQYHEKTLVSLKYDIEREWSNVEVTPLVLHLILKIIFY